MKIYITGLPSGYEVEHLARLFYPMAPLTLTPPEPAEDCLWAEKTDTGLRVLVRQGEKSKMLEAPLPLPVEQGGETPEFALASLTYDLLRQWTGIRPPWGKMTGVRPVRLIHDKRAAGWSAEQIDRSYHSMKWNTRFQNSLYFFLLNLYYSLHYEKHYKPAFHPFFLIIIREQLQDWHRMIFEQNIGYK